MKLAKALTTLAIGFGVAQFSCASVATMDIGGTGTRSSSSMSFSSNSLTPAFAIGDVQDRGGDSYIGDNSDSINSNSSFNSLQSFSLRDDSGISFDIENGRETDSWVMLAVGVGLIGYQLRRSQRSLLRAGLPSMA